MAESTDAAVLRLRAELHALEQLLEVHENSVIEQSARLEQAVRDAQESELKMRFLSEASAVLGSSLHYEQTLQNLANLAVPGIADWCAVEVVEPNGELKRLAVAHTDPAKVELVQRLHDRYPDRMDAAHGVPQVIRTNKLECAEHISDELLAASARDEEHLEILRSLGLRSYIIAPLPGRGTTLGALVLVQAESGRSYEQSDCGLAEELARRAGIAIDNARLVREIEITQQRLEQTAAELEAQTEELQSTVMELEQTMEELRTSNEAMEEARSEAEHARHLAEDANAAKSQFLATMSHELRTPLNAIDGYAELLQLGIYGTISPEQAETLRRIRRSQKRLLSLINNVLNFAKLEAGQIAFDVTSVRLDEVLIGVETLVAPQVNARALQYRAKPIPRELCVLADAEKTEQILLNLLTNAIKFTEPGGTIEVSCRADEDDVSILVKDTGRGIPADRLGSIFEPFVQVDTMTAPDAMGGVGLGLAISRDLARAMSGDLEVESTAGVGSTFVLKLPRAKPADVTLPQ